MKTKVIAGVSLLAVLAVVGIGFALGRNGIDQTEPTTPTEATGAPESVELPLPEVSLPAGSEEARLLMEINGTISDITREALERRNDDRMTTEEIQELVRTKIEELGVSP